MRKRDREKLHAMLIQQRDELMKSAATATSSDIQLDPDDFPDEIDTASSEANRAFQGHLRDRARGLLAKVENALEKIEDGVYGECEDCGGAIDPKRLFARPVAELCVHCKNEQERLERNQG